MNAQSVMKSFMEHFKFKGFSQESLVGKAKWIAVYPFLFVLFVFLVIGTMIGRR